MIKRAALVLVTATVGLGFSALAGGFEVKLSVEEPAGLARRAEPVSGGIPLPAATFRKDQPFAVFNGAGEVPAQALPMVVDEKGFVRWLLVDFQTDLGARETKTYTLRAAKPAVAPASPLKVADDASGVTVDTGRIRFVISREKPFGLFGSVSANGKDVVTGGEALYVDATVEGGEPKTFLADKPASVVVEYAGALRATVCAKGRFVGDDGSKLLYIARVTAWAGRSDVHVKYTLANSNDEHYSWRRIRESTLRLKLAGGSTGSLVAAGKPLEAGAEVSLAQGARTASAALHSDDSLEWAKWYRSAPGAAGPGAARAVSGEKELWTSAKGETSEGWLLTRLAGGSALAVHDLYFVEDPPRRLALAKGVLELSGVAPSFEGVSAPFGDRLRWISDCSHLSSQYWIDFAAAADGARLSEQAKAARARPHVMAPPDWYFSTKALAAGEFGTQADEIACYDQWGWKYDKKEIPAGPEGNFKNMPRWMCGDDNHRTSEQDSAEAMILMYLRTGRRAFFDRSEVLVNYFMDLQAWRTDGWRWKDGALWWAEKGGPLGNRPQRAADPLTGWGSTNARASFPAAWTKEHKAPGAAQPYGEGTCKEINFQAEAKACYCHNWGEGNLAWYCLTGGRDALEAGIDTVEMNYDGQKRGFGMTPGKAVKDFGRSFNRACYMSNAARLCVPTDPFIVEANDYLSSCFLTSPGREPRGYLGVAGPIEVPKKNGQSPEEALNAFLVATVGEKGVAEMKKLGVTIDPKTCELSDPRTGAKWFPINKVGNAEWPPLSRAMEAYWRITGNEDALDWTVAFGEAQAHVSFQPKHGNLSYRPNWADFPVKGFFQDVASWQLPEGSTEGEGVMINGYNACFLPDTCARAYALAGDPFLKKRAYDWWYYGSHRGYNAMKMNNLGRVAQWINVFKTHDEKQIVFSGRTFRVWAHPRADELPPKPVTDLKVAVSGGQATVTFTAPADEGGGRLARYQLKCSDKPIVDYRAFLERWKENKDSAVTNWWQAANLAGEPAPGAPGGKESFTVSGVPAGARHFALVAFDDSSNRSGISNAVEAGR
ncbi:MAG TPA: hypothetical protein PK280_09900 [Planctomycetota bacterium]|nr:hypothetical protein [Planctomycetota bacterium]